MRAAATPGTHLGNAAMGPVSPARNTLRTKVKPQCGGHDFPFLARGTFPMLKVLMPDHDTTTRQAVISVLVENEAGVLARVIGLFSGRGYNIDSLTVAPVDEEKHLSRITIVTSGTAMWADITRPAPAAMPARNGASSRARNAAASSSMTASS